MKNKELIYKRNHIIIIAALVGLVAGVAIGMVVQQMMITQSIAKVGESWEGVISEMNIEIDLNETQIVDATYKKFPELKPE